jgi:hypothetical protein
VARSFRDIAGRAHQQIAALADEVYLAATGMVVRLVPEPLKAFRPDHVMVGAHWRWESDRQNRDPQSHL